MAKYCDDCRTPIKCSNKNQCMLKIETDDVSYNDRDRMRFLRRMVKFDFVSIGKTPSGLVILSIGERKYEGRTVNIAIEQAMGKEDERTDQ